MSGAGAVPAEAVAADPAAATARLAETRLVEILLASLGALAAAGDAEAACRLAGQACVTLRKVDQKAARRFDVLLHRLSGQLTW